MSIVVPNRRLAQPVIGASPIPGCRALFDMRWGVDLITGRLASVNSATRMAGRQGQTHDFSSSANVRFATHPNYAITSAITVLASIDLDTRSTYGAIISKSSATSSNVPYELRIGSGISDGKVSVGRANAGGLRQFSSASDIVTAPFSGIVGFSSGTSEINSAPTNYVNGVAYATALTGGTGSGAATDNGADVWIGRRFDGVTQLDGRIYWIALFDRALDTNEIRDIWADPSIIFPTQPRRRSRVGVAGAPPGGIVGPLIGGRLMRGGALIGGRLAA